MKDIELKFTSPNTAQNMLGVQQDGTMQSKAKHKNLNGKNNEILLSNSDMSSPKTWNIEGILNSIYSSNKRHHICSMPKKTMQTNSQSFII